MNNYSESNADITDEVTQRVFAILGASDSIFESLAPKQNVMLDPQETSTDHADASSTEPWILCVEDDRDFSLALQLRLKRHGLSVVRAFDGVCGLQSAMTSPAEAIILDYNLPNGRGDYVLRRLKANPLTRDIPVIVVSGQKTPGLEKEMLHLGAIRFFAKPVRFEELLEELQKIVPVNGAPSIQTIPQP